MKIAALSDIHSNITALQAVLSDISTHGADFIVNLGDIVSGPLQPRLTAQLLMDLAIPTVAGNHERQVLSNDPKQMGFSDQFARQDLEPDHLQWLGSLPQTLKLDESVMLIHASPSFEMEYLLETVTPQGIRQATISEVAQRVGSTQASLIICGHSHTSRSLKLPDGPTIVNPGSVGLQAYEADQPYYHRVQSRSPHARYALIEGDEANGWQVEFRQVPYDWESCASIAQRNGREQWSHRLRTGFVENP